MIGQHTVDFLGHAAIVRTQPRFDMGHRYLQLGCGQRPGQRGVGIAVDQDPVRPLIQKQTLDGRQHTASHIAMAAAADAQMISRGRQLQLFEEDIGHLRIKMLAGVDQDFAHVGGGNDRPTDRSSLDELWPRADYGENAHPGHSA